MITLYHHPHSRSSRFIFLLEELGAPYEIKLVDIRRRDGTGSLDPKNPHPHGKVPVIDHDGEIVFESTAIVLYLTDAIPAAGIAPKVGDAKRGAYVSWLAYYGDVFEPAFVSKMLSTPVPRGSAGWVVVEEVMAFIDKTLTASPYLLGDAFSAVDILYATSFALFANSPLLPKLPSIEAYTKRCLERPAYQRAQARENG